MAIGERDRWRASDTGRGGAGAGLDGHLQRRYDGNGWPWRVLAPRRCEQDRGGRDDGARAAAGGDDKGIDVFHDDDTGRVHHGLGRVGHV
jgi:hypothetical protein